MKPLRAVAAILLLAGVAAQDDLKAQFESKRATDPVEAFRLLAQKPGEAAQSIARPAIAKQITADLAAGLKAYGEGKAGEVEKPFMRAALLSEPYASELSKQLMKMLFLLKQARKTVVSCATCKGAGAAPCTACQAGFAPGPCPRCEAKGTVACLLCTGSGQLDHFGYKGTVAIIISNPFKFPIKVNGKMRTATTDPQTITYHMKSCGGTGGFQLDYDSVNAKDGKKTPGSTRKSCEEFWDEMKRNVFTGKAKIQVANNKGQLTAISPAAGRRFFSEYETCKNGHISCDRCLGKKTDPCSLCQGKGQAPVACAKCEGSTMIACAACRGYGDGSWLAGALPPAAAPALCRALAEQAATLREWFEERSRREMRLKDLALRLVDAKKDLDPTAKLTDDTVDIVCPKCKAGGSSCEECWNAGRREYTIGTSQYERYAVAQKFDRQLKELEKGPAPLPALPPLPEIEAGVVAKDPVKPTPPPVLNPSGGPAPALAAGKSVEEMIQKADELYETGKTHLQKSKAAQDNATWQDEAVKALQDLKSAQILYTAAQEAIDAKGAPMPKSLLEKHHLNMQALVMARKQAP